MNSGKIVAGGWTGGRETSKVLQEVLADLKMGGPIGILDQQTQTKGLLFAGKPLSMILRCLCGLSRAT